jgi:hypothetical protein
MCLPFFWIIDVGRWLFDCWQGDGGVYFSTNGPASYGLGSPHYEKNIIVDCFGPGRLNEYLGKHKLDVCFVYGAEPEVLSPAPGGRDNAVMVTKATFESLALPSSAGEFFLRPDRILGACLIDPQAPPGGRAPAKFALDREAERDCATKSFLADLRRHVETRERAVDMAISSLQDLRLGGLSGGSAAFFTKTSGGETEMVSLENNETNFFQSNPLVRSNMNSPTRDREYRT